MKIPISQTNTHALCLFVFTQLSLEELKVGERYSFIVSTVKTSNITLTCIFVRPQAQLGEKTTLLSEARLKEQGFIEKVSFRTAWGCVFCVRVRVGVCSLLGTREQQIPTRRVPMIWWPPAKGATALLLHPLNQAAHLFTFGLT